MLVEVLELSDVTYRWKVFFSRASLFVCAEFDGEDEALRAFRVRGGEELCMLDHNRTKKGI